MTDTVKMNKRLSMKNMHTVTENEFDIWKDPSFCSKIHGDQQKSKHGLFYEVFDIVKNTERKDTIIIK